MRNKMTGDIWLWLWANKYQKIVFGQIAKVKQNKHTFSCIEQIYQHVFLLENCLRTNVKLFISLLQNRRQLNIEQYLYHIILFQKVSLKHWKMLFFAYAARYCIILMSGTIEILQNIYIQSSSFSIFFYCNSLDHNINIEQFPERISFNHQKTISFYQQKSKLLLHQNYREIIWLKPLILFDRSEKFLNLMMVLYYNFMRRTQLFIILILTSTFIIVKSGFQAVGWPQILQIKTGDHKLIMQPLNTTNYTYDQYYGIGYSFNSTPFITLSMRDLKFEESGQEIDFKISVVSNSIGSLKFQSNVVVSGSVQLIYLYYMYMAMSSTYPLTYFYYFSEPLTSNSTVNNLTTQYKITKQLNRSIAQFNQASVIPFFVSFRMKSLNQSGNQSRLEYSISASGIMVNSSEIQISILSNSSLQRIQIMLILVDTYEYELGFSNFFDKGVFEQYSNGTIIKSFQGPIFTYFNAITGITTFRFNRTGTFSMELNTIAQNFTQTSNFIYVKTQMFQWRTKYCSSNYPFYSNTQQRCYDSCQVSFYTYGLNTQYNLCVLCSLSCSSCSGSSSNCTTCNGTFQRSFNSSTSTCDCNIGYFDNTGKACQVCHYSCLTCQSTASKCTSCVGNRTLTNDSCPCNTGYYDSQTNNSICSLCDSRCKTCINNAFSCLSCENSTQRTFDQQNLKCPCRSGFAQNSSSLVCQPSVACVAPCMTCSLSSSNCTSCDAGIKRIPSGTTCVCFTGYSSNSPSSPCSDTCGDGIIMENLTTGCDDGNTFDGDGCSSSCQIQTGFNCTSNNATIPNTICKSLAGYQTSILSLIRDDNSNTMAVIIQFSPIPPSNITPSLLNLQTQLQISSFSLDSSSGTMLLNLNIIGNVEQETNLLIGFSLITSTASFPLKATNRLQIAPFSNYELNFYKVQGYLVWVYIGLVWISAIIFVVFLDISFFPIILELFIFISFSWIAVEGQDTFALLYLPLRNLRYIFGFNLQIGNAQSLLQVFNVGSIMFLIPFLCFLVVIILNKKTAAYISTKVKRFVLFDILYGLLITNAFLIAYGLGIIAQKSSLSTLDIGGIVFGALYFILLGIISKKFFVGIKEIQINPKLEITKRNLSKPQIYALLNYLLAIISIIYISFSRKLKNASLISIGILAIIFIAYALGNIMINKIKYMISLVQLIFIFGFVLLSNTAGSTWSGLAITVMLYLELFINATIIIIQKSNKKRIKESEKNSEVQKIDYENNLNQFGINLDRQPQFDNLDQIQQGENKSALAGHYQNHFTVYEPTIKKPPQIMAPPPEFFYQTNAIQTAMKTYSNRADKDRLLDKRLYPDVHVATTPKSNREEDFSSIDFRTRRQRDGI